MHILLIDDECDFLEVMQSRLEERGVQVTPACSGILALEFIDKEAFDAVVLDVKMPEMDGFEVLKNIKEKCPELAVLLLSGHAHMESAIAGVEDGAADYLIKPLIINDLITRLHDITNIQKT